jgi:hypothetical protein
MEDPQTLPTKSWSPIHYLLGRSSTAVATALSLVVVLMNFYFPASKVVDWDTFGYYLYLPQALIVQDLEIKDRGKVDQVIQDAQLSTYLYQLHRQENGNHVMKYSMGMALLYSPAFAVGHLVAGMTGAQQDGYSAPYMVSLKLWCILVSLCGIWLLRAVLVRHVPDPIAAAVLVLTLIGTNYIHNVCMAGHHTLSHNFLFTGYALLLWLTMRWHAAPTLARILPLGLCAGLMILARPTEIVCLLLPLAWGVQDRASLHQKGLLLARSWRQLLAFSGLLLLIALPQLIYWKWVTGSFLHASYGGDAGEGFEWAHPFTWEVLVGFRKGWLIYTPIATIGLAGLAYTYRHARALFWPILLYLVANLYLVSAWSCYWYANHFGQRALIPALAVMGLPMGMLLDRLWQAQGWTGRLAMNLVGLFAAAAVVLNVFQTYQFQKGIIDGTRMTRAAYFTGFADLTFGNEERNKRMLPLRYFGHEQDPRFPANYTVRRTFQQVHFPQQAAEAGAPPVSFPGSYALHKGQPDTPALDIAWKDLTQQDHAYLQAIARVRYTAQDSLPPGGDLRLITHFSHLGKTYAYRSNPLPIRQAGWVQTSACQLTPEVRNADDLLRIYLRYEGADTVFVEGYTFDALECGE